MLRGHHAVLFVGHYEHSIDAKQRLAIPSEVRAVLERSGLGSGEAIALYAVIQEGPTLALYTEAGFEKRAAELDHSQLPAEQVLAYEQLFFSRASRVELDKQGRVRLPERLIRLAGLDRDVVILGVKDHLQVHDRDRWNALEETLSRDPAAMYNPRRLLRNGAAPGG